MTTEALEQTRVLPGPDLSNPPAWPAFEVPVNPVSSCDTGRHHLRVGGVWAGDIVTRLHAERYAARSAAYAGAVA